MASRTLEIQRLRGELSMHQDLNSQLLVKKKQLEEELSVLRERNSADVSEICTALALAKEKKKGTVSQIGETHMHTKRHDSYEICLYVRDMSHIPHRL